MNSAARAPVLIGAVGGSGTRVVTRILAQAKFFIGAVRNHAEDSAPIMDFYSKWLRSYLISGGTLSENVADEAGGDFSRAIAEHRRGIAQAGDPWAVKVPRSLLMLPYWRDRFPKLQFIQVIRNGLDMAYSTDKYQLEMFQDVVLTPEEQELPLPLRAIAYWRTANLRAAAFGRSSLGSRYLLLRFEDLCRDPQTAIRKLAEFVGVPIEPRDAARYVSPPASIDRWREHPPAEVCSLVKLASPALECFGYRAPAPSG